MFGDSYYGFTQWAALSSQHPALRALVPRVTSTSIGSPRPPHDVPWMVHADYLARCWTGPYLYEQGADYSITPVAAAFEKYFDDMGQRSLWFDATLPRELPFPTFPDGHPYDVTPVPTLHCVGWFDNLAIGSMRDYVELTSRPAAAPSQYLFADAIDHENYHLDHVPIQEHDDHNASEEALERMLETYLDPAIAFFDVFLKESAPPDSIPRVQWNLGHVGYRTASAWPPPGARAVHWYLVAAADSGIGDVDADGRPSDGALSLEPPTAACAWEWRYDPTRLVSSVITNSFAFLYEYPDERAWRDHDDVLVFSGPRQDEALDLAGPIELRLRVASTAPTTDVFAKLCDLAPDGTLRQIVRGQLLLRAPDGATIERVDMGHTGYRVRPGHRLQLLLSSSDFPEFPPNSGTTENRWTASSRHGSEQRLSTDAVAPACLVMTTLPAP
jgi:putative CocE/NonD family hydrolase